MPEEIETESLTEDVTETETGTEVETVETIIIVPGYEEGLSGISGILNRISVTCFIIAFLLLVLCLFTIVRRSD